MPKEKPVIDPPLEKAGNETPKEDLGPFVVTRISCPFCGFVHFIATADDEGGESDAGLEFDFDPENETEVCEHIVAWKGPGDDGYQIFDEGLSQILRLALNTKFSNEDGDEHEDMRDLVDQSGGDDALVNNVGLFMETLGMDEDNLCAFVSTAVPGTMLGCSVDGYPDSGCPSGAGRGLVAALFINAEHK